MIWFQIILDVLKRYFFWRYNYSFHVYFYFDFKCHDISKITSSNYDQAHFVMHTWLLIIEMLKVTFLLLNSITDILLMVRCFARWTIDKWFFLIYLVWKLHYIYMCLVQQCLTWHNTYKLHVAWKWIKLFVFVVSSIFELTSLIFENLIHKNTVIIIRWSSIVFLQLNTQHRLDFSTADIRYFWDCFLQACHFVLLDW